MRCRRTPMEAEVLEYKLDCGMEDGFTLWSEIVTAEGYIITDNLIKIQRPNGSIVCPYIAHHRGRTYINEGDYIIIDDDGTKHVCGKNKVFERYEKL
ncbi:MULTISPECIES: hypothetical protein [Agathobacter]|uniref:Uncharacterized protein n=1 Tax=Agathobacter ruminis TaxID=1712665 RepID=A0A2G3DZB6_9FIRM|nr:MULTISPECIES: hypothetical protein [Agathobacter]MCR5676596.1 hypothetical protein [Agathobacter sp.]MDC7300652.1 hypothetical protein [Agathobacter ruminis]PHU36378.1 hypothetical protein CSX02_12415 [Agathobacter ruminis]